MKKICSVFIAFSMIFSICNVFASSGKDADAVNEAAKYFLEGVNVSGDLDEYIASNGVAVDLKWSDVYDNTIADERGSYLNSTYLADDGKVTAPKWYEGTKKLKGTVTLTAGAKEEIINNINVSITPQTAPDFASAYSRGLLTDYIDIGNSSSETVKDGNNIVKRFESVRDNGIQTNTVDGAEHTYRTLNKNGAMAVTMKCDSDKINYLTVKLWGNDTGDTMLWLCDPTSGNMNLSNSRQPTRNSIVDRRDWVELSFLNSSPQYSGGFIYSTYMIPEIYTKGKEYVSLRIYSTGGNANYNNVTIKEQTSPSRGIYAVYLTQGASFDPEYFEDVSGSIAKIAKTESLSDEEQKNISGNYAKAAVETFKSWQIYGQDNYPSYMEGMVTRGTGWKKKSISDTDWKDCYYSGMTKQNLTPLNMYELFSYAYTHHEQLGYDEKDREEFLDRIVKGVDFLTRAQGSNGGFYSQNKWIGGPNRHIAAGNNLTGFGLRSVAQSMIMICPDVNFAEMIDSDADGTIDCSRADAWEKMASAARDYLVSLNGAGHAPNQDMANIIAALRFEKALQLMGSDLSWKAEGREDKVEEYLDIALGFKKNIACSSYWVSPKGLILENFGSIQGGYSGDYGTEALEEMSQLAEFAEDYYKSSPQKAKKYTEAIDKAYDVIDKFLFTANAKTDSVPTLYSEGLISNRNAYYPGAERYIINEYSALHRGNKTALKGYELFFKHNKLLVNSEAYTPSNAHFEDNAIAAMKMYLNFDNILSKLHTENIADYNYLMEDDNIASYAWADEMGRNVVIKNGDERIYIAMNWRNPVHSQLIYNTADSSDHQKTVMNNLARVHCTNKQYDKYGYAEVNTEGWNVQTASSSDYQLAVNHYIEAFMYMNYGDYSIVMNSNNLMGNESDIEYNIPVSELGLDGLYTDMISGEAYSFGSDIAGTIDGDTATVKSASTMVLCKTESIEPNPTVPPSKFKITVTDKQYNNGNVCVVFKTYGESTVGEDICIYASEYNTENKLVGLKMEKQTIKSDTEVNFSYDKQSNDGQVRIFVWNEDMKPYE